MTKEEITRVKKNANFSEEKYHIESLQELQIRANDFIEDILNHYKGKNILIVSHAGIIINLLTALKGETNDINKYTLDNSEICKYDNK